MTWICHNRKNVLDCCHWWWYPAFSQEQESRQRIWVGALGRVGHCLTGSGRKLIRKKQTKKSLTLAKQMPHSGLEPTTSTGIQVKNICFWPSFPPLQAGHSRTWGSNGGSRRVSLPMGLHCTFMLRPTTLHHGIPCHFPSDIIHRMFPSWVLW